jgi:hypothetical protein
VIVAFDEEGRPSFNVPKNYGSSPKPVICYVFDVLVRAARTSRRMRSSVVRLCFNDRYFRS